MALNNYELSGYLKNYYSKVFPSKLFYDWLSYGQEETFSKREFSFTLEGDIYIRYQSFENFKDFSEELKNKIPQKIDIGAVYNIKPKLSKNHGQIVPLWKELVFDIDMTDYDDVRLCCCGNNNNNNNEVKICEKCWTLMKVAVRIIDRVLRDDFGFDRTLWVYSGRRGVHCWVCDGAARSLSPPMREAIVSYLSLVKAGRVQLYEDSNQWCNKYHPSIVTALSVVKENFSDFVLRDQRLLEEPEAVERLLSMLPASVSEMRDSFQLKWLSPTVSGDKEEPRDSFFRWKQLSLSLERENQGKVVDEIMLACLYPRLDTNVSIGMNHLLKSPFCVHPSTGRICVPFSADRVNDFDPFSVPTVVEVLEELQVASGDIMSTKLGGYLKIFEDFINSLSSEI